MGSAERRSEERRTAIRETVPPSIARQRNVILFTLLGLAATGWIVFLNQAPRRRRPAAPGGHLSAHAAQERVPPPLPDADVVRHAALARRTCRRGPHGTHTRRLSLLTSGSSALQQFVEAERQPGLASPGECFTC